MGDGTQAESIGKGSDADWMAAGAKPVRGEGRKDPGKLVQNCHGFQARIHKLLYKDGKAISDSFYLEYDQFHKALEASGYRPLKTGETASKSDIYIYGTIKSDQGAKSHSAMVLGYNKQKQMVLVSDDGLGSGMLHQKNEVPKRYKGIGSEIWTNKP